MTLIKPRDRLDGWRERVLATVARFVAAPYDFGKMDCFQMLIAVEADIYGSSIWARRYGTYDNEETAMRELRARVKSASLLPFVDRVYTRIAPADADVGDVTFRAGMGLPHIMVYDGKLWCGMLAPFLPGPSSMEPKHVAWAWRL